MRSGAIRSRPARRLEPGDDIARIPVRGKNGVKDVLYFPVLDHKSQALQQSHPARLECWQAKGSRKAEVFVRENRERQVQPFRSLALISRILSGKTEEILDA